MRAWTELQKAQEEAVAAASAARAPLRAARAKGRSQRRNVTRNGNLLEPPLHLRMIACAILVLTSLDDTLAADFVSDWWRRFRSAEDITDEAKSSLKGRVMDWYLAASDADLLDLTMPTPARLGKSRKAALAFLGARAARDWVDDVNKTRGLAPSSSRVFEIAELKRHSLAPGDIHRRSARVRLRCRDYRSVVVHRWRRRWSVRLGSVPTLHVLAPHVLKAKARCGARIYTRTTFVNAHVRSTNKN